MPITFHPYRTIGLTNITYIKPDHFETALPLIRASDDPVLFPESWQIPTLVYGLKKRIFPSIESYQIGYDKAQMTRVLTHLFPEVVPYTLIKGNSEEGQRHVLDHLPFPFIAKDIRSARGQGVYWIDSARDFAAYAANRDVLYAQEYLPIDRDLRVCVVGKGHIADAYWRISGGDFRTNVARGGHVSYEEVPEDVLALTRGISEALNIDHAGFDWAYANGKWQLFEFNVLFGNQGIRKGHYESALAECLRRMREQKAPIGQNA